MLNFGLGEKTLIDLPDEVSGRVINLESRQDIEYATASFGQGIAMSPINITRALASLANGGVLVRPHLVKEFKYDGFPSRVVYTEEQGKVLSKETSERISRMLVKVVDEALVGGKAKLPQHTVAAKTGTAQIANPTGGYYEDRFLHSFFGYFPAYKPKFLIFMYIVNPKTGRYSSETLTDPFMNITKFLLNYYEIPPDR
jgi:cell division protein FtsI/penicillin-binding protein 2